ncbi:MAG: hypothetical protein M5R40_22750 [Anaerolineae bacterium]|nr:hypothetical protein [Anaerolineae bacterium]
MGWGALGVAALVIALWAFVAQPAFMTMQLSPYKGLVSALRAPGAAHAYSTWDAVARVDVVESASIHALAGLSMQGRVDPPPQVGVTLDGDNLMPVTGLGSDDPEAAELARWLPLALPFTLRPNADALVIDPGGGFDVLVALAAGAEHVTLAEDNALLIEVVAGALCRLHRRAVPRPARDRGERGWARVRAARDRDVRRGGRGAHGCVQASHVGRVQPGGELPVHGRGVCRLPGAPGRWRPAVRDALDADAAE